jgi:hypothetical protein
MLDVSGKGMKILVFTVLLFFCKLASAYDPSVAIGQWAIYQKNYLSADYYYFLNINPDYSGALVRYYGDKPIVRKFDSNAVIRRDGYFEVQLSTNEKAVFSAWKLKSGSGKLTGQIFMYKENGELFNMLYFPLQLLNENHEILNHEAIKELSAAYR